jgi:hypothetical protein
MVIDYLVMKEMGWSWQQLESTPERVFLSISRIISLQAKETNKRREKVKRDAESRNQQGFGRR